MCVIVGLCTNFKYDKICSSVNCNKNTNQTAIYTLKVWFSLLHVMIYNFKPKKLLILVFRSSSCGLSLTMRVFTARIFTSFEEPAPKIQYPLVTRATVLTLIIIHQTWTTSSHLVGKKYFTPTPLPAPTATHGRHMRSGLWIFKTCYMGVTTHIKL